VPIKKDQGIERLVLRAGGHLSTHRQVCQESAYLRPAHFLRMTQTVKANKTARPFDITFFRARRMPHLIEKVRRRWGNRFQG
jgi:hypothetical protein